MNRKLKAQSAMEYLMTYGWAILIIAVVLGALFSLGVFSTGSFLSNACIPSSGYLCTIGSYPHGGTTFTVTLGQSTTSSWTANVFVAFVPQGTTLATGGVPDVAAKFRSAFFYAGNRDHCVAANLLIKVLTNNADF